MATNSRPTATRIGPVLNMANAILVITMILMPTVYSYHCPMATSIPPVIITPLWPVFAMVITL